MSFLADASTNDTTQLVMKDQQFTNLHGVPFETAIFAAYHSTLYTGGAPRAGKLSTTTLIGPIRKALYGILYPEQVEARDVMTMLASAKGTAMHQGMTNALVAHDSGYVCEKRMEKVINEWEITGEFDILTPTKQIKDLKFVSNYNIKKLQEDQEKMQPGLTIAEMYELVPTYFKYQAQLSIYRHLLDDEETKPYGSILFMLNNGSDMGKYTVDQEVTFPLWPADATHEFIHNRVELIKTHLANGTMPLCSDAERGYSPPEYKLQRVSPTSGTMSTVRGSKHDTFAEFQRFVIAKGKPGDVEVIKEAKYALCAYCQFSSICDQQ